MGQELVRESGFLTTHAFNTFNWHFHTPSHYIFMICRVSIDVYQNALHSFASFSSRSSKEQFFMKVIQGTFS